MSSLQDKILQSTGRGRSVTVTNDGATILKSLHIDNPAAKVLVGILTIVAVIIDVAVLVHVDYNIYDHGKFLKLHRTCICLMNYFIDLDAMYRCEIQSHLELFITHD